MLPRTVQEVVCKVLLLILKCRSKISQIAKLLSETRDFAIHTVTVAKMSHILGRFGAPFLRRPPA